MIRLSLAAVAGAVCAGLVAARIGGTAGAGVWAGFLLGGGVTGLGVLFLRHTMVHRPERAMAAFVSAFLAKLAFLLMGTLAFRFLEPAAARVDWRTFLVAFAVSVAILLPLGAMDAAARAGTRGGPRDGIQKNPVPRGSA